MEFTYENQGSNTYLVYGIKENDVVDTMSLGMLTNNKIPGLAPALFTQMDEERFIKYNVTAKISAKEIFMGSVNRKRLLGVLSGIVNAISSAEEYMIDPKTLLLDMEYIFSDVSTCETILICLPVEMEEQKDVDYGAFFKNIVFSTRYDQTENCDYVAKLINYLNGTPVFSLAEFKTILDELNNADQPKPVAPQVQQPVSQPVKQPVVQQPVQPVQQPVQPVNVVPRQYSSPVPNQQVPLQKGVNNPQVRPQMQQQAPMQARPVQQNMQQMQVPDNNKKKSKNKGPKPIPGQIPGQMPGQGMRTPVQPVPQNNNQAANGNEKKMSMFHLMMHYSKENAQIYKEQHNKTNEAAVQPQFQQNNMPNQGFAIPGQQAGAIKPMQQPQQQYRPVQPQQPVQQPVAQSRPQQPVQQQNIQQQQYVNPAPQQQIQQPVYKAAPANFGDTTVLGVSAGIGETTVLNAGDAMASTEPRPYLIRTKYNEKILIDKPVFKIGKEKSYVDYFVSDNTAISRSHANIIEKGKDYFIIDTNSTNHTFVNGSMIQSNMEMPIKPGDKIKLANEEFEFRIL